SPSSPVLKRRNQLIQLQPQLQPPLQVDYMLRLVSQEQSLPQQMQPLGLQERLGHQTISMESPMETVHIL
ncbi:uncharacterized protein METZ01_LOCUS322622, partial [marine metagenome]